MAHGLLKAMEFKTNDVGAAFAEFNTISNLFINL